MNRGIVSKIVNASGIVSGDLVAIQYWGEDLSNEVVTYFSAELAAIGATPLLLQQSKVRNQQIFEVVDESCYGDKYFKVFESVDVVIDLIYEKVGMLLEPLEPERMKLCGRYMGKLFGTLQSKKKFLQVRIPSRDNAISSGLSEEEYMIRMDSAYNIDYTDLKVSCTQKVEELKLSDKMTLYTGEHKEYQLHLSYKNRAWNLDCGDGDLPCGEVYIAPNEKETEGNVWFDSIYLPKIGKVKSVVLTIVSGVVVRADKEEVNNFLNSLPECDKVVAELGFGMNKNVISLCGYTLLDEKKDGTFHIAIGDNTMFGGENEANIHMDFVGER